MKASFDGARRNLAMSYNKYVTSDTKEERQDALESLRSSIGALLCMYDPDCPSDVNDLSDSIHLEWAVMKTEDE